LTKAVEAAGSYLVATNPKILSLHSPKQYGYTKFMHEMIVGFTFDVVYG